MNPTEKNAVDALYIALQMCKVQVTRRTLKEKLWQHPDFPSLASLSETLNELKVSHLAARLTSDRLQDIPFPAISYLRVEGGILAPIRYLTADRVEWFHTRKGWQYDRLEDFYYKWTGVMLLIEPDEKSGDKDYVHNKKKERIEALKWPFILLSLSICVSLLLTVVIGKIPFSDNTNFYSILLVKTFGVVVSGSLVWYNIDRQNEFLQNVCHVNSFTNCQSILNASAAKLTSWLSWAEVGFYYFMGGFLGMLTYGLTTPSVSYSAISSVLLLFTCLSLPYTLWSIYYQVRVVRQWCLLCLTVQVILWIEFIICFNSVSGIIERLLVSTTANVWGTLAICFILPIAFWTAIRSHLQKSLQSTLFFRDLQRLKFSPEYLSGVFDNKRFLPPIFAGMKTLNMGNPMSRNTLIIVSNPNCAWCRQVHFDVKNLIMSNPDFYIQIILATSGNINDKASEVARQILSLPNDQMADALHHWFAMGEGRITEWIRLIGGDNNDVNAIEQQTLHLRWLELAGVMAVPTMFLNQVELPKFYTTLELSKLSTFLQYTELANLNK